MTIDSDGTVTVSAAAMDQGSGTYTVLRQLVAEELQVPLESVNIETLDSTQVLKDQGLGGSRGTRIYGNAAYQAVTAVKEELLRIAAEAMGTEVDKVAVAEGGVTQLDAERRMTLAELAGAKGSAIKGEGHYNDTHHGPGSLHVRSGGRGGGGSRNRPGGAAQGHRGPEHGGPSSTR